MILIDNLEINYIHTLDKSKTIHKPTPLTTSINLNAVILPLNGLERDIPVVNETWLGVVLSAVA